MARWFSFMAALLLVVVTLAVVLLTYFGIPGNAAGMAAKGVCSAALVAGRPQQNLMAQDVLPASPVLAAIEIAVNPSQRSVTATFAGMISRTAVLLPQRGCVLDTAPDASATPYQPTVNSALPWPEGEAVLPVSAWPQGVQVQALQKVVDQAFVGAGDPKAANARGVAVVHQGRLLVHQEAPGFENGTALHGWSMAKTVTGMLAYKLFSQTGLAMDTKVVDAFLPGRAPAWVEAWRQDERQPITVADLMFMRDGLASTEDYQPWGSVPQMLWGAPDVAAWAASHPVEVPAATRWRYLSATSNMLAAVARGRFKSDAEYWAYPHQALFAPIGARSATMETDTSGNWVGSSYVWASVGDWARLGQLMLQDGQWQGRQVLPKGWLQFASTASMPVGEGAGYGAQSWLIGQPESGECRSYPRIPVDTIAMQGHWGQLVAIVPSKKVVVVRLGWTFKKQQFNECQFLSEVLASLP
jgi:CubicO group peptidase (beta-lactamase class C family)